MRVYKASRSIDRNKELKKKERGSKTRPPAR
jgi:hypothetical protein